MDFILPSIDKAIPEIVVLSMACVMLIFDLYLSDRQRVLTYLFSIITLVVAAGLTLTINNQEKVLSFGGTFISDRMADVLKIFVYMITAVVFVYARGYLKDRDLFRGEFYSLGLFGVLGMMILISAHNFLTVYLGLELLSLSMYAMVALNRDSGLSSEAAMKYFVLGALASGLLLYGMSMLYGVSGTLDIEEFARNMSLQNYQQNTVLILGMVMVIVGLAFKLGAVPFHMWVPDVYHGAPTAVTLYISTAPKIAAFAMVMRLLVEGLGEFQPQWQSILIIMAILSMAVGNIIAIAQTNIKRMLAYSTISHIGFLLVGILSGTEQGYSASMFYTLVYTLMSAGGFGMLILLSRAGFEAENLNDLKGLNERSPWFAFVMLVIMFSMAGVPPTVGFWAKLSVLQAVVNIGMVWVAILAVVFSIIGAFYYLRVIKLMYFDKPEDNLPIQSFADMKIVLSANSLFVLGLGMFPGSLLALCAASIH